MLRRCQKDDTSLNFRKLKIARQSCLAYTNILFLDSKYALLTVWGIFTIDNSTFAVLCPFKPETQNKQGVFSETRIAGSAFLPPTIDLLHYISTNCVYYFVFTNLIFFLGEDLILQHRYCYHINRYWYLKDFPVVLLISSFASRSYSKLQ